MKYLAIVFIFLDLVYINGCEREIWEKNRDLTAMLTENQDIDNASAWNTYANAPILVRFKDKDDGYFYFSDNPEEVEFEFYDEGDGIFRVNIEDETKEQRIEVVRNDSDKVIVRFPWSRAWVAYVRRQ